MITLTANRAFAQPVATADEAVRIRFGVRTVPVRDEKTTQYVSEQRAFVDISDRVLRNVDLGVGLPTVTLYPEVDLANPFAFAFVHFSHEPHWLALRMELEPPVVTESHWRTFVGLLSTLRLHTAFEIYNRLEVRIPITDLDGALYSWLAAILFKVTDTFAIGPSAEIQMINQGYKQLYVGARARWALRNAIRTWGAFLVEATTSEPELHPQSLSVLAHFTLYIPI